MTRPKTGALIVTAALAAVFTFWPRRADAAVYYGENPVPDPDFNTLNPSQNTQLAAFLWMIRNTEHTRADALSNEAYNTFYGGSRFYDLSDHPVITGEKKGVRLPDAMCRNAGFNPGCVSTAAGAYQIIVPTWKRVRKAGSWGPELLDFSPASQDEAARRLLIERGALQFIDAGRTAEAIALASKEWASLPGSTAKQNPRQLVDALALFDEGLQNVYG